MITFNSQEEFEDAVVQAIIDKLDIKVFAKGFPFMTGVEVALVCPEDAHGVLIAGSDDVA